MPKMCETPFIAPRHCPEIDIAGDLAVAHKKFDGSIRRRDGTADVLHWQTLYFCRRVGADWRLTGFIGYMPFALGAPTA